MTGVLMRRGRNTRSVRAQGEPSEGKAAAGGEASGEPEPAASLSLGFQPPELGENQSPRVCHPVCGIVMAALANLDIISTSLTTVD